jgi:hypothetical protein
MLYLKSKTMPKSKPTIAPNPTHYPYLIYYNPRPVQQRLMPQTILIYRPTCTLQDEWFARSAVLFAAYHHMHIVTLNKWQGVPGIVRREAAQHGVKVILCKTLREAWNSADVRWCGVAA